MRFKPDDVFKVCPFMMMANAIKGPDANGDDTVDINCIGESCAMWCWLVDDFMGRTVKNKGGFCGLSNGASADTKDIDVLG